MIRAFGLVTHGFELVTRGFELITRTFEFQLVLLSFELVTRNFCLTTSLSFLVQTCHFHYKIVATTFSSEISYSTYQVRYYQFFTVEIIVEKVNLIQMSK